MKTIVFCTGNELKFTTAQDACKKYGLDLVQRQLNITEIQAEDYMDIAIDKASKAYDLLKAPVVITDDAWEFAGLNGFPGAYMHSINRWFEPEDFLNLLAPNKDRSVTLTQVLVYKDEKIQKIFKFKIEGKVLDSVRGKSETPSHRILSLEGDNGLSIAEAFDAATDKSSRKSAQIWEEFVEWYLNR